MKRLLLLLGIAALFVAVPAFAQYIFVDVSGDGLCDGTDVLVEGSNTLHIYLDTGHNKDGSPTVCTADPNVPDSVFSYEFILRAKNVGPGDITWGAYTNLMGTMTVPFGVASDATDYHNGFGGTTFLAPAKYELGTLLVTVAPGATPILAPVASSALDPNFFTAFGSSCPGDLFDSTIKLGLPADNGFGEFTDACGPGAPTPTRTTTWGAIKNKYK